MRRPDNGLSEQFAEEKRGYRREGINAGQVHNIRPADHEIQHGQQFSGELLPPPFPAIIHLIAFGRPNRKDLDFQTVLLSGTAAIRRQYAKPDTTRSGQRITQPKQTIYCSAKICRRIEGRHHVKNFNLRIQKNSSITLEIWHSKNSLYFLTNT